MLSLTVKRLPIECAKFNKVRQRFYQVPSLRIFLKLFNIRISLVSFVYVYVDLCLHHKKDLLEKEVKLDNNQGLAC